MKAALVATTLGAAALLASGCGNNSSGTASCTDTEMECGGKCVDVTNAPENCGACGNVCGSNQVCSEGVCGASCSGGTQLCDGLCVNLDNDPGNCGTCGNACADTELCSAGTCTKQCTRGEELCGDTCVSLDKDPNNCGSCGNACGKNEICAMGSCGLFCPNTMMVCGTLCVDLQTDMDHCGTCDNACTADETCNSGACVPVCTGNEVLCTDVCADTTSDPDHCGDCNTACDPGVTCTAGKCVLETFAVDAIDPAAMFAPGGKLTVTGQGLDATVTVKIGSDDCTSPTPAPGGKSLTCLVPPKAAGTFDVVVTRGSTDIPLSGAFTVRDFTTVDTIAGDGTPGDAIGSGDKARFSTSVNDLFVVGDMLYVADGLNYQIRTVDLSNLNLDDVKSSDVTVAVLAGSGSQGMDDSSDGTGATATFEQVDSLGAMVGSSLYVSDTDWTVTSTRPSMIRSVDPATGDVKTLATNGTGGNAGVAYDGSRYVYIAECGGLSQISRLDTQNANSVSVWVGDSNFGDQDGVGTAAELNCPLGIALDESGEYLYVAEYSSNKIKRVEVSSATVETIAGSTAGATDATGNMAKFKIPVKLSVSPGNLFVADWGNCTVRMVNTTTFEVTTLAGAAGSCTPTNATKSLADARFGNVIGLYYSPKYGIFVGSGNWGTASGHPGIGIIQLIH